MRHYVVTLKRYEDLDSFYEDMETPGGNLYIPNRAIEPLARRPISRNTHYLLTDEEAALIAQDERVLAVELDISEIGVVFKPFWTQTGNFEKSDTIDANDKNWALYRCISEGSLANWGTNGQFTQTSQTISTIGSGKNVDVVVVDNHINFSHPEFAVNTNGTGGQRAVQFNWYQYSQALGYTTSASYSYGTVAGTHGTHVAGTVAGNTQGWARDANIYNISYSSSESGWNSTNNGGVDFGSALWDYLRYFHRNKPINSETKKRNPTITNHSYGMSIPFVWVNDVQTNNSTKTALESSFGTGSTAYHSITSVNYRGTTTTFSTPSTSSQLTEAQLLSKINSLISAGIPVSTFSSITNNSDRYFLSVILNVPYLNTALSADIFDALSDGIVIVAAAGNSSFLMDTATGVDYNNILNFKFNTSTVFTNPHRGSSPGSSPGVICVGNIGTKTQEYKHTSSNFGPRIDIWAPGTNIVSSVYAGTGLDVSGYSPIADPRNSSFFNGRATGTSMASPQVCGVLACMSENWVRGTQIDAYRYLGQFSKYNVVGTTGGGYSDSESLNPSGQSINNRFLYYDSPRDASGFLNFKSSTYTQRTIPTEISTLLQLSLGLPSAPTQGMSYPRKNTLVFKG